MLLMVLCVKMSCESLNRERCREMVQTLLQSRQHLSWAVQDLAWHQGSERSYYILLRVEADGSKKCRKLFHGALL